MYGLNLNTFLILIEILCAVYVVSTLIIYFVRKHIMHLMMSFSFLVSLFAFELLRQAIADPNNWAVILYNVFTLIALVLMVSGFRAYFKLKVIPKRYVGYMLLGSIGFYWFISVSPSYIGRVFINTIFMALFVTDTLIEAREAIEKEYHKIRTIVFVVMYSWIIFTVLRFIIAVFDNPINDIHVNLTNTGFALGLFSLITFNFWIIGSLLLESNLQMTNLKEKSKKLENLAMIDPLTRLYNRHQLDLDMEDLLKAGSRQGTILSLLMMDLDHFKEVNDNEGHNVGDQVLMAAAQVILNSLRSQDRVYRWGGDEFLILTPQTDNLGARRLADRIRDRIETTEFLKLRNITVSIGCAQHFVLEAKEDWFKRADLTLYKAKQMGRNHIEVWQNDELLPESIAKLEWSETYGSGIDELDDQHKGLIDLSNELYDYLVSSKSVAELDRILDRVMDELQFHFTAEVDLMKKLEFPLLSEHIKIHDRILREYDQLRLRVKTGTTGLGDFFNFVSVVIIKEHIAVEDAKFFDFNKSTKR